jgi:hypothetical protein
MKLTRLILACTLLLLASTSLYALPVCKECINNQCVYTGDSVEYCFVFNGMCDYDPWQRCSPFTADKPVMADWTVASIEITRPAPAAEAVTATPAAPAAVRAAEPAARK